MRSLLPLPADGEQGRVAHHRSAAEAHQLRHPDAGGVEQFEEHVEPGAIACFCGDASALRLGFCGRQQSVDFGGGQHLGSGRRVRGEAAMRVDRRSGLSAAGQPVELSQGRELPRARSRATDALRLERR